MGEYFIEDITELWNHISIIVFMALFSILCSVVWLFNIHNSFPDSDSIGKWNFTIFYNKKHKTFTEILFSYRYNKFYYYYFFGDRKTYNPNYVFEHKLDGKI
jgi:hypothetical protein